MAQIKITLVKGVAGSLPAQRRTVKALGLGKINSSVIREDNPVNRGMVNTVQHLVKVEEV
jgi:large subunit ribosomal protein L30